MKPALALGLTLLIWGMVLPGAADAAASWKVVAVPGAPPSTVTTTTQGSETPGAISCVSASMCMAVGSQTSATGAESALAELWNGASWTAVAIPGATGVELERVSCWSGAGCTAVGDNASRPVIEMWNGVTWSSQTAGSVSGISSLGAGSALYGVSCTSATFCMAVGGSASAQAAGFAETWNGTSWTGASIPDPSHDPLSELTGVSCGSPTACVAVGSDPDGGVGFTAEWNGTAWTAQSTGALTSESATVSCGSATACEAVGIPAEHWNGTTWSKPQSVPGPYGSSDGGRDLAGVSCPAANVCTAVGTYDQVFAEAYNGSGWTPESIPRPVSGSMAQLDAVSCWSPAACMAVGTDGGSGSSPTFGLADEDTGGTWSRTGFPVPPVLTTTKTVPAADRLSSVSCADPGSCTAVGWGSAGTYVLAEGTGGRWSAESSPNPGDAPASETSPRLESVSCSTARRCQAVGSFINSQSDPVTFAEGWDGTAWSLEPTPDLNEAGGGTDNLASVSCTTATRCRAVGDSDPDAGSPMAAVDENLAEVLQGDRWVLGAQPPSPAEAIGNSPTNALGAISCFHSTCTAVGAANNDGGGGCHCGTLALRLGPGGWSYQRPSQRSAPTAISCPGAHTCVAVGEGSAVQIYRGGRWTYAPVAAAGGGQLSALSCATASLCVAVGTRHGAILVVRWNGRAWSGQSAPTPSGAAQLRVNGVSCPSAHSCVLVGSDRTAGAIVPLIETYSRGATA
jgi:hypothetical protein